MTKNVYSVGQVNTYIKNMFAQDFMMNHIYVRGEVSNCKYHSSGHIYFTLKDKTGTLNAIMFAGSRRTGLGFPMKEGDNVIVLGAIRVYERDGKYQLYAEQIVLEGAGILYQKFEQLKQELEEMGMFAPEYKLPIPRFARTVGVVTAPTGAAVRDIQSISARRNPYVQLILYPAQVQGEGAAASIVNGIRALEQYGVDVMIVGRGGGSIEDLWAFNEEVVARAIFECSVPIISAVGHETDTTIADYVADLRAPTPSAAAELAVFDIQAVMDDLAAKRLQLNRMLIRQLDHSKSRVEQYRLRLELLSPQNQLLEKRQQAMEYEDRLQNSMERILMRKKHQMEVYAHRLEGLSPLRRISSGCAYVTNRKGEMVRSVSQVQAGDMISLRMLDGTMQAEVKDRTSINE
ncbi:MAG: exodeoxyribonuclease VII large subunit [Eubacterium sp.]|nr:exodeoxyribonuclease VII large subunit [Eubacterium sp.]